MIALQTFVGLTCHQPPATTHYKGLKKIIFLLKGMIALQTFVGLACHQPPATTTYKALKKVSFLL